MDILLGKRAAMTPRLDDSLFLLEVTNVAVRILNIVAASAERVNSVKLRLDTKERNRLFHHRVTKFLKFMVNRRIENGKKRPRNAKFPLPRNLRMLTRKFRTCCLRGLGLELGPCAVQRSLSFSVKSFRAAQAIGM